MRFNLKRLFHVEQKEKIMAKADVVSAAKAQFVSDQDSAVQAFGEKCYDGGASDQAATDGGATQSQVDALMKQVADLTSQLAASQGQDQQDAAAAKAAQDQVASLQATVDQLTAQVADLSSKLGADESIINGFKNSLAQLQAVVSALAALQPQP